jgi:hypothetical protein
MSTGARRRGHEKAMRVMSPNSSHGLEANAFELESCIRRAAASLAVALAAGCTVHVDDGPPPPNVPYFDVWEQEPNDGQCCPDPISQLWVGDQWIIGGTITELGPDFFDGFAFQNVAPCDIEFELQPLYPADLDLCVFDPQLGEFAFCFESSGTFETGRFSVPDAYTDFHLVVSSYINATEYRLLVRSLPISFAAVAPSSQHAAEKSNRAVPLERYIEACEPDPEDAEAEPVVVARGELIEIDPATGEIVERAVRVIRNPDADAPGGLEK